MILVSIQLCIYMAKCLYGKKLYHKSNLFYTVVLPQFLIFQKNNSAETSVLIFFTSRHYYFFEKLKIGEKQLCKLNCSYGKITHALKNLDEVFDNVYIIDTYPLREF